MGRAEYNEVINRTEDEQMLLSIVKGRYGETYSLLAVSGVAANVRFSGNAGVDLGFGPESYYEGNLLPFMPFSRGLTYEENPTITYTPVQGEQYLRQLLSPLPLSLLVLIVRSSANPSATLTLLASSINDMQNPDFLAGTEAEPDPGFKRFAALGEQLNQAGCICFFK